MPTAPSSQAPPGTGRDRLLAAAVGVIRERGLHATTVDDLCAVAGVSKGAFFHHFENKEALAVAAADYWSETTAAAFADAPYHDHADPVDRVLGYLDFRDSLVGVDIELYSCLVGTMVQEAYATNPSVRDACGRSIFGHAATLEADIAAALSATAGPTADERAIAEQAASLARYTQIVLQGAFVVSKAANDPGLVHESIGHLRHYFASQFGRADRS
ncbi:MAG: TetR/AcrR family transcriptional regulator [Acidimicrobiia bacterium]